jgi:hypothetical protein
MKTDFTREQPPRRRLTGYIAGYTLVLIAGVLVALSTDFRAQTSVANEATQVAAVSSPVIAPVVEAAFGAAGTGTLSGVIQFDGNPPTFDPLVKKGDSSVKDAAVCSAQEVPNEELVINKDNKGIANVFVYLQKAPAGVKAAKPTGETVFDQKACQFLPHALLVRSGEKVLVKSDDPIPHNTHTYPVRGDGFNKVIAANDRKGVDLKYTKPERLPVKVVCDYHNWMKAFHLVLDHPYMAVTDADGKFTIPNLPAGKHEFIVWQEKAGYLEKKHTVQIKSGETKEVKLSFGAAKFASFNGPPGKSIAINTAP